MPAHVTLFHHLPGAYRATIDSRLAILCREQAAMPFATVGVRFLGRGCAYVLDVAGLVELRHTLAIAWSDWLTLQDRQRWAPHVTVQNKAPPVEARRLHESLLAGFVPQAGIVIGLRLWRYLQGPWDHVSDHRFGHE